MFIIKISFVKTLKKIYIYIHPYKHKYNIWEMQLYFYTKKKKSIGKLNDYLWRDCWGHNWWPGKGRVSFCSHNFLYSLCILYFYEFLLLKMTFLKNQRHGELCSFPWFKIKNHTSISKCASGDQDSRSHQQGENFVRLSLFLNHWFCYYK